MAIIMAQWPLGWTADQSRRHLQGAGQPKSRHCDIELCDDTHFPQALIDRIWNIFEQRYTYR